MILNRKYAVSDVLTIHSAATAAEFGSGEDYPLKVQTTYIDTFQGMAMEHMFCNHFKYSHVTVFASGDYFGRMATIENTDGVYCQIYHLVNLQLYRGATDWDDVVSQAKFSGANVFFLMISEPYIELAAELLDRGFQAGLFKEGTQIFGSEQMTTSVLFNALEERGVDVPTVMKGYMNMKTDSNYHLKTSENGLAFIDRWRRQPATQWTNDDQSIECDQSRDGPDNAYLFRDGISVIENHTCGGLDFSSFAADGSDMAKFLGNTYDATYVLAYGLHELVENGIAVTGTTLHDAILEYVDFIGASGHIDIYEGN